MNLITAKVLITLVLFHCQLDSRFVICQNQQEDLVLKDEETFDNTINDPSIITSSGNDGINIPNDNSIQNKPSDELSEEEISVKEDSISATNNVPLREILLRLKPASLMDEEEDESSRYSPVSEDNLTADSGSLDLSSGSIETVHQLLNISESKNSSDNASSLHSTKQAMCEPLVLEEPITDVQIVNASTLQKILINDPSITSRSTVAKCHLIYFFSPYCPFSARGSAYVNGMARSLNNIPAYGLDSIEHHNMNARYGVMGTPSLILFHNGLIAGRYNASEYSTSQLVSFINHFTTENILYVNVTSEDFRAPLPSHPLEYSRYTLWLAWSFLLTCGTWLFLTSQMCAKMTELVLNNWREAEAQHAHED